MAAYVIADVEITDPQVFEQYRKDLPESLKPFGGTYRVRGGALTILEGDWKPNRLVIIEFPDMAAINAWYDSPAYQALIPLRRGSARASLLAVEGV